MNEKQNRCRGKLVTLRLMAAIKMAIIVKKKFRCALVGERSTTSVVLAKMEHFFERNDMI